MQFQQRGSQLLIEAYSKDKGIYPSLYTETLKNDDQGFKHRVAETQKRREGERIEELEDEKRKSKEVQKRYQALSDINPLLSDLRDQVIAKLGTEESFQNLLQLKPLQFRKELVRIVFGTGGEAGEELRDLWILMYKGNVTYGIMNQRKKAESKGWPVTKSYPSVKYRNSWISFYFRKASIGFKKEVEVKSNK